MITGAITSSDLVVASATGASGGADLATQECDCARGRDGLGFSARAGMEADARRHLTTRRMPYPDLPTLASTWPTTQSGWSEPGRRKHAEDRFMHVQELGGRCRMGASIKVEGVSNHRGATKLSFGGYRGQLRRLRLCLHWFWPRWWPDGGLDRRGITICRIAAMSGFEERGVGAQVNARQRL